MSAISLADADAALVPFVGTDESRPHLMQVCGVQIGGWRLGATNGHTAALVRCDAANEVEAPGAPPLAQVAEIAIQGAQPIGELSTAALDPVRELSAKWQSRLALGRAECRLTAKWTTGSKSRKREHVVFNELLTGWYLHLDVNKPRGIAAEYLLDACDLLNTPNATVWSIPDDPLAPMIFTATAKPILTHDAFAIVMPVRL